MVGVIENSLHARWQGTRSHGLHLTATRQNTFPQTPNCGKSRGGGGVIGPTKKGLKRCTYRTPASAMRQRADAYHYVFRTATLAPPRRCHGAIIAPLPRDFDAGAYYTCHVNCPCKICTSHALVAVASAAVVLYTGNVR